MHLRDFQAERLENAQEINVETHFSGTSLIIAPHPDDESLGCGGTIALLKNAGRKVHIFFVSDGSLSHPNSKKYDASGLVALRKEEAIAAAKALGVDEADCSFLMLKDGAVAASGDAGFEVAVNAMGKILLEIMPAHIFLPWKNDPHPDHKATWQMVNAAVKMHRLQPTLWHYLIWFWERGEADESLINDTDWYKINISNVVEKKQAAIAAHVSQVTGLIDDDPDGFTLSPEVLAHFSNSFELFIILKT